MEKKTNSVKSLTAYNRILNMIFSGEALPGSRLVLTDLEEKLQMGRGPLREALIQLDKAGIVKNIPYKGAVVSKPASYKEMEYVYTLRLFAEVALAQAAVEKITDAEIAMLTEMIHAMQNTSLKETNFFRVEREFYSTLYSIADMPHLHALVESMLNHVEIFLISKLYEPQDRILYIDHYERIVEALIAKDKEKLCATLESNIVLGVDIVKKQIEKFKQQHNGAL